MARSAPTGCGKTVVLELALVKFLRDSRSLPGKPKAVYRKRTCLFLSELELIGVFF
jgi:replicative superfamily II helicase